MKKRDKDRLRLWQDRLGRANAAYEPELSKMDGREELYQGCNRIRPIVCTARKKETPHVRNLCAELVESQVTATSPSPRSHPGAERTSGGPSSSRTCCATSWTGCHLSR